MKQETGFTQVKNEVLEDKNLSWKAKGLFTYLYSRPDGWDFSIERIVTGSSDDIETTQAGLLELEKQGYLKRQNNIININFIKETM